jgi:hypothetical protein
MGGKNKKSAELWIRYRSTRRLTVAISPLNSPSEYRRERKGLVSTVERSGLSAQNKFVGGYEVVSMSVEQSDPGRSAHFLFCQSVAERRLAA